MVIYILIIIYFLICVYKYDYLGKCKGRVFNEKASIAILILLAGLRFHIGTDSAFYEQEYITFPTLFNLKLSFVADSRYAPLYVLFNSVIRTISGEFVVMQLLLSAFVNCMIYYSIKKYTDGRMFFSFLLMYFCSLYYNINCETLRESVAVGIFLYSLQFLFDKKLLNYYICVFVAVLFHYGAVFLVVIPLFSHVRITKVFVLFFGTLIVCYPILRNFRMDDFLSNMLALTVFGTVADSYTVDGVSENSIGFNVVVVQYLLPLFCYFYIKKKTTTLWVNKLDFLMAAYLVTTWCSYIFFPILSRFNNYLGVFYYIYYSSCILVLSKHLGGKKSFIIYIVCMVPFMYTTYNSWVNAPINEKLTSARRIELINPYTTVFDKTVIRSRETIYNDLYKY